MTDVNHPEDPGPSGSYRLLTLGRASLRFVPEEGEPEEILGAGKPLAVLVYLASSPDHSATRDHLVDLLWANLDLDSARHALRQALWYLRKRIGREAIRSRGDGVALATPLDVDHHRFLDAIENGDLQKAIELYRGEFLPVFAAPGGARFEKWTDTERYRLRTHFLRAARTVVQERLADARFEEAKDLAERAREAAPLRQQTWRLLLETLVASGDQVRAKIESHAFEKKLEEIEGPPKPSIRRLIDSIREQTEDPGPQWNAPSGRLFEPELIGREEPFAKILAAWQRIRSGAGRRLHVTGAAGVGKSRLLAEVEARLESMGARVVHLKAQPGERDLPYAFASALAAELSELPGAEGVPEGAASSLVALNPKLTDTYPIAPDRSTAEEALRHRSLAVSTLFETVASAESTALLIDDLHWVDRFSRQVLSSLFGKIRDLSVLVVTTSRGRETEPQRPPKGPRRIELRPFTEEEIERSLASLGTLPDTSWADDLPRILLAATGGSPLLLLETLRLALDEKWLELEKKAWRCPTPELLPTRLSEGEALRRRVEDLPIQSRRLLLQLAVSGRDVPREVLEEALPEVSAEIVEEVLRDLEVRGFVSHRNGSWRVAHDELAGATLDAADSEELRRARRSLGVALSEVVQNDPDELVRAGRHLLQAGEGSRVTDIFTRWTEILRGLGDRRAPGELAEAFAGEDKDVELLDSLVGELPMRLRLRPRAYRTLAAASLVLIVSLSLAGVFLWKGSSEPDVNLYVFPSAGDGTVSGRELALTGSLITERAAIGPLEESSEELSQLEDLRTRHPVLPSPSGDQWAYVRTVTDSGGWEAYLVEEDGSRRRLTFTPGDDVPMAWSPDGRYLVVQTSRWNRFGWHSLALVEVGTGEIRRLTTGPHDDHDAVWSNDGTRIAFRREVRRPLSAEDHETQIQQLLCRIDFDGTHEECFEVRKGTTVNLLAWEAGGSLLALVTEDEGDRFLGRLERGSREFEVIDASTRRAVVSPDGRWIACLRSVPGEGLRWHAYRIGRRDRAVILSGISDLPAWALSWGYPRGSVFPLERLEIRAPDTAAVGVPQRLRAEGFTKGEQPLSSSSIRWSLVSSSERASIDSEDGLLLPLEPGPLAVRASAGGWRSDTVELVATAASSETLLTEAWGDPLKVRWIPFGSPRPVITNRDLGHPSLWVGGDGTFHSGVYSRWSHAESGPVGAAVRVATPRTAPASQELHVGFYEWSQPGAVEVWDHRTGALPAKKATCSVRYPGGDGMHTSDQLTTASGNVSVDQALGSGDPYTLTLQLFPDGTCGIAVDGKPIARSDVAGGWKSPLRIVLQGKSVDTRMVVDSLRLWRGIREYVDWADLEGWNPAGN